MALECQLHLALERIARIATEVFAVPTAWYRTAGGLNLGVGLESVPTPSILALEREAIRSESAIVRTELSADAGLGFYAGAPVNPRLSGGPILFSILDSGVREFSANDRSRLSTFAELGGFLYAASVQTKMEALRSMAYNVAHDINANLTVVMGNSEMMLSQIAEDDPLRSPLNQIRQACDRAAQVTDELYEYSGRSDRPQPSYLNQILTSWRPDLELATEKSLEWRITGVPLVDVDAKQIKAGILDLASRVHVSSAKSGRVRFATRRTMDGKAVVSLTAPAISKDLESLTEELSKLPPYRGSKLGGLGAYLARIGASIEVQHSPGVGDSIELYFPGLPEAKDAQDTLEVFPRAAESSACPKSQKAIPAGTPITALVVDDEPGVRKLVAMTMRRALNWKVMEAGDIEEALRAAKSHDGPIHVLFSDVVLPRASGGTIAAEVTKFHPDIRVIFASAYDELSGIRRLRDQRPIWFIRKAFTSEALLKLLNEVVTSGADQHSPTGTPDL